MASIELLPKRFQFRIHDRSEVSSSGQMARGIAAIMAQSGTEDTITKSLVNQLAQYAAYHGDSHNIVSHLVGIPLIVVAVAALILHPAYGTTALTLSPVLLVASAATIFYRLDVRFGMTMAVLLALSTWAGQAVVAQSTSL
jgi:hypothetical protein